MTLAAMDLSSVTLPLARNKSSYIQLDNDILDIILGMINIRKLIRLIEIKGGR